MTLRILLTGSNGFIGRRLCARLLDEGHEVVCVVRDGRRPDQRCVAAYGDFAASPPPHWQDHLFGVDVVVNAAGIFRETRNARFADVHTRGPIALFDACAAAGVGRVIQLSAVGATADAATEFLRSKHAADVHLLALPLDATVVQPSLVFGLEGRSTRALLALASLPLMPLPERGWQCVQPLHVEDLVAALLALIDAGPGRWRGRRVTAVGPAALSLRDYLSTLRAGLHLGRPRPINVPGVLVRAVALAGERLPGALFDRAAWEMLRRGSVAASDDMRALLGRPMRTASAFIETGVAGAVRAQAQLDWLLPLARGAVALLWVTTAIVSLGVFPIAESLVLLERAGVPAALRPAALYGAAVLDLLLGIACLLPWRRRRWLWAAQALLIVLYSLVIALRLPDYWLHPFGPLTKNVPLLALLVLLWVLDRPHTKL